MILLFDGVHSYDSWEFFHYLMVFDAMCKKIVPSSYKLSDMSRKGKLFFVIIVFQCKFKIWMEVIDRN